MNIRITGQTAWENRTPYDDQHVVEDCKRERIPSDNWDDERKAQFERACLRLEKQCAPKN